MALGILEPSPPDRVPVGTVLLEDDLGDGLTVAQVLVPQPTESHYDPLNMSRARKELYFLAILYGVCAVGAVGPLLIPGFSIIATQFHITLTQVTLLNGALILTLGLSSYLCAPLANICGRRALLLATNVISVVGCIWASYAATYASLLASRAVQGLGMGGFMSLAGTASINDVFFVHERGRRVGLWNSAVLVSVNLTPVISGYVITQLGWAWSFRIMAIAFGLSFLLTLVFIPETLFDRDVSLDLQCVAEQNNGTRSSGKGAAIELEIKSTITSENTHEQAPREQSIADADMTTRRSQRRFGLHAMHADSLTRLPRMLASPVIALKHPAVLWATAMWCVFFTWVIIQGAVADQIYRAPPYNMSAEGVGILIGVSPLIGSAVGTVVGGWSSDILAKALAMKNNGIYEPEFRLLLVIPGAICTAAGAYGLGLAIGHGSTIWASAILLGLLNFGVGIGCTSIVAYTNDAISHIAADSLGIAMLIKSIFAFGLTFVLNDYYADHGPVTFFSTWASLSLGVSISTCALYVFGKRIRGSNSP